MTMFDYKNCFQKIQEVGVKELLNNRVHNSNLTVCIPTYKRDHLLETAVKSIWNQSEDINVEILIVDNDFERIEIPNFLKVKSTNVRYLVNEMNLGMFGNWNRSIIEASSNNLIILCDDDWLDAGYFKEIKKYLGESRAIMGIHSYYDMRKDRPTKKTLKQLISSFLKNIRPAKQDITVLDYFFEPLSPLIMFRKDLLIEIGGFDESYFPGSDVVLYANYVKKNKGLLIKKNFSFYRIDENESKKPETALRFPEINMELRKEISKNYELIEKLIIPAYEYDRVEIAKTWHLDEYQITKSFKYWTYAFVRVLREFLIATRLWRKFGESISINRT